MLIPVRCRCGKITGNAWARLHNLLREGVDRDDAIVRLGFTRTCCRTTLKTHIDLTERAAASALPQQRNTCEKEREKGMVTVVRLAHRDRKSGMHVDTLVTTLPEADAHRAYEFQQRVIDTMHDDPPTYDPADVALHEAMLKASNPGFLGFGAFSGGDAGGGAGVGASGGAGGASGITDADVDGIADRLSSVLHGAIRRV